MNRHLNPLTGLETISCQVSKLSTKGFPLSNEIVNPTLEQARQQSFQFSIESTNSYNKVVSPRLGSTTVPIHSVLFAESFSYAGNRGTSICQVTITGMIVILLYASRACYNLVVLALAKYKNINSFDYDWYNVSDQTGSRIPSHVFSSRAYFFDNPRRYDSDDDLAWNIIPQNSQASLTAECYDWESHSNSFVAYIGSEEPHSTTAPEELNPY
ncbi:UNVERIFIED_CONTAM: hypothetical protein FKN15_013464 [Acipenser sinensis]